MLTVQRISESVFPFVPPFVLDPFIPAGNGDQDPPEIEELKIQEIVEKKTKPSIQSIDDIVVPFFLPQAGIERITEQSRVEQRPIVHENEVPQLQQQSQPVVPTYQKTTVVHYARAEGEYAFTSSSFYQTYPTFHAANDNEAMTQPVVQPLSYAHTERLYTTPSATQPEDIAGYQPDRVAQPEYRKTEVRYDVQPVSNEPVVHEYRPQEVSTGTYTQVSQDQPLLSMTPSFTVPIQETTNTLQYPVAANEHLSIETILPEPEETFQPSLNIEDHVQTIPSPNIETDITSLLEPTQEYSSTPQLKAVYDKGKVVDGAASLLDSYQISQEDLLPETQVYQLTVFDEKTKTQQKVTVEANSWYAVADRVLKKQGYQATFTIQYYTDSETGEERSGLRLKEVGNSTEQAKHYFGQQDDRHLGILGLKGENGETAREPGQGTINLEQVKMQTGDTMSILYIQQGRYGGELSGHAN